MSKQEPVVLELAPLPREQMGPFLILGIDKDADKAQIEAAWARRIIARKNQIRIPLEDINWAREVINDPDRRVKADAGSLNVDTMDRVLGRLAQMYGEGPSWQPLDVEKPLTDYSPAAEVPDCEQVRSAIVMPPMLQEVPAAIALLEALAREPIDPWDIGVEKGVRHLLPERPGGCCAQKVPDPFFDAVEYRDQHQ